MRDGLQESVMKMPTEKGLNKGSDKELETRYWGSGGQRTFYR